MNGRKGRYQARAVRLSLAVAALAAGWGQASYAAAAGGPANEAAAYRAYYSYTDGRTGESFYDLAIFREDGNSDSRVLMRDAAGAWALLPEAVSGLAAPTGSEYAAAYLKPGSLSTFDGAYYDAKTDTLVDGNLYVRSPNGKWGFKSIISYDMESSPDGGYRTQKMIHVLMKSNLNGVIREIGVYPSQPEYFWLPDGSLLEQRYSEADRQNEVVRIDPASGQAKRLVLGSLRAYENGAATFLFARNEPARTPLKYDLATGRIAAADAKEAAERIGKFRNRRSGDGGAAQPEPPAVPADLDLDALPVAPTAERAQTEGTVLTGGLRIPVPYLFYGLDGRLYVPVRPLAAALGWKVDVTPGQHDKYEIGTGQKTLTADKSNSIIFDGRLFVRLEDVRAAGYPDIGIEWTNPGQA